jgi:membrane protein required for beta-lactamase induction
MSSAIARVSVSEVLLLLLLQMFLLFLLFAAVQELAHQIDPLS